VACSNDAGLVTKINTYGPFGEGPQGTNAFDFTGQRFDAERDDRGQTGGLRPFATRLLPGKSRRCHQSFATVQPAPKTLTFARTMPGALRACAGRFQ